MIKIFFCKKEFIQGNIYESKKEITKFCNKLPMKINLLVEVNNEKYNLNCTKSIHKILNCKPVYTLSEGFDTNFVFPAGNLYFLITVI